MKQLSDLTKSTWRDVRCTCTAPRDAGEIVDRLSLMWQPMHTHGLGRLSLVDSPPILQRDSRLAFRGRTSRPGLHRSSTLHPYRYQTSGLERGFRRRALPWALETSVDPGLGTQNCSVLPRPLQRGQQQAMPRCHGPTGAHVPEGQRGGAISVTSDIIWGWEVYGTVLIL